MIVFKSMWLWAFFINMGCSVRIFNKFKEIVTFFSPAQLYTELKEAAFMLHGNLLTIRTCIGNLKTMPVNNEDAHL